jgi:carbonic anhydrase
MSYPIVRSRVLAGAVRLSGWWFDVASGTMGAYDRDSRTFKIIDRQLTERFAP